LFIPNLENFPSLYQNDSYKVIVNPKLESYDNFDVTKEDHLPNYLTVNKHTKAIEFASDQLVSAGEVADKLKEGWSGLQARDTTERLN